MKKTIIGGIITITGTAISLVIMIVAGLFVPTMTSWSGSKFWFAIFGGKQYGYEVVQSLFLGFPFVMGVILLVIGLIILALEYFKKE